MSHADLSWQPRMFRVRGTEYWNDHVNVAVVMTAAKEGWELVWRNPTHEEEFSDAWQRKLEPGSNDACPMYGCLAKIQGSDELLTLWVNPAGDFINPTLFYITRSETEAEYEAWKES